MWCDESCNNKICNFDNNNCNYYDSTINCKLFRNQFIFISNYYDYDYMIDEDELCDLFYLIKINDNNNNNNCSDIIYELDIGNNYKLNAYESTSLFIESSIDDNDDDYRSKQIDCSLCSNRKSLYYMPWSLRQIYNFTNF